MSRYSPSSSRSRHLPATGKSWPICPHSPRPSPAAGPARPALSAAWAGDPAPTPHLGPQRAARTEAEGATPVEGEGTGRRCYGGGPDQQSLDDYDAGKYSLGCSRRMSCHWMPTCWSRTGPAAPAAVEGSSFRSQVCSGGGAEVGLPVYGVGKARASWQRRRRCP